MFFVQQVLLFLIKWQVFWKYPCPQGQTAVRFWIGQPLGLSVLFLRNGEVVEASLAGSAPRSAIPVLLMLLQKSRQAVSFPSRPLQVPPVLSTLLSPN